MDGLLAAAGKTYRRWLELSRVSCFDFDNLVSYINKSTNI